MKYLFSQRNKIIADINGRARLKKFKFGGIDLLLNKYTLVPSPDTQLLIQLSEKVLGKNRWIKNIADVGTGSGLIAISLAKKFPGRSFFASDISKEALDVAEKNSVLNKTTNIRFLQNTDNLWLSEYQNMKIDFIISNPPFVGEEEFNDNQFLLTYPEVILEPTSAILTYGDKYGLSPYLSIINNSNKTKTKVFLFQCNSKNIELLTREIKKVIQAKITLLKDGLGKKRFLEVWME